MGAVTFSIDPRLIGALKNHLSFDIFVETGTFRGETIDIIKDDFNHIYSVELSEHYYKGVVQKFGENSNITLLNSDSAKALKKIMASIQERPTIFWLDAHWCVADATAGELSQCPLLDELGAISQLNDESMIIIDDARLFLTTPGKPHEISDWPTFHDITKALFKLSSVHQLTVVNDCILFFPESMKEPISKFAHEYGVDWLDMMNRCYSLEAMAIKLSKELEMFHNMGFWKRVRGILGYSKRCISEAIRVNNPQKTAEEHRITE